VRVCKEVHGWCSHTISFILTAEAQLSLISVRAKKFDTYTVNHKKRGILFLTITLANPNRFYSFYIILIVKKYLHVTVVKNLPHHLNCVPTLLQKF